MTKELVLVKKGQMQTFEFNIESVGVVYAGMDCNIGTGIA